MKIVYEELFVSQMIQTICNRLIFSLLKALKTKLRIPEVDTL